MRFVKIFLFLSLLWGGMAVPLYAESFDHSSWDAFLKKNVSRSGEVHYQSIAKDPKPLQDYLDRLMMVPASDRETWPREEQLAFWLNAYHATLIKLIVEHYPTTSVQKIPSFWDITAFHAPVDSKNPEQYSLNDIRVKKLIGVYHDEKIHLALSLAAKDGPALMAEAFTGPRVEGQLFLLTRRFVNDPAQVGITVGQKKIRLSRIFKWYGQDFKLDFGTPEPIGKFSSADTAVLSFLMYYLEDEEKGEYLQQGKYKIEYVPFNWALNDQDA